MRLGLLVFILALLGAHQLQKELDEQRFQVQDQSEKYFLPNKNTFKVMSLGHDEAVADLLWIRTILFSTDFIEDCNQEDGQWLNTMLRTIVHLESNWETVYHYGSLMLELCDQIVLSDELLELGHKAFPDRSRFAFLLSNHASEYHKDLPKAIHWMKIAAESPDSVPWYSAAVSGLLSKEKDTEYSIRYLQEQLQTMPPSIHRDYTEERLRLLIHDVLEPQIEARRQEFIKQFGRPPIAVSELALTIEDPYTPKGGKWIIADDGHVRSSVIEEKEKRKAQRGERELIRLAK